MQDYTIRTEVKFYASLGYTQSDYQDIFTIDELGLTEEDLYEMSERELEEYIKEAHDNWMDNFCNFGWEFV